MSSSPHKQGHDATAEHGTVQSYVVGFVLSVIFTLIPYYLVVNQTVTGGILQATILGFALIQMIIQVTFFLHIGRGPKPRWNLVFFVATFAVILMVVSGSVIIINNLHYNMSPSDQTKKLLADEGIAQIGDVETGACQELYDNYTVTIKNGQVSPVQTTAKKCDTLTFINKDAETREITFGAHPEHGSYGGETELVIEKGRSETISLSELGTFQFHDHIRPDISGNFTVTDR